MSVAGTRDALAQNLMVRGVLVNPLESKGAALAGQTGIASWAEALLHLAGRLSAQLHTS